MLPSTFEDWHIGETHTWQHGYGQSVRTARCDYIAIPFSWRTSAITSQPIAELDSGTTTRDHIALLVCVQRTYVKPPSFRASYDRERIAQIPECHYRQLGKDLQQIQWDTNVHEQAIRFTDIINEWLQQHSPVSPSGPRKGYIRNDTWNIRTARTTLTRMRRKLQRLWTRHKIQVALYAWRSTRLYTEQWDDQLHVAIGIIRELRLLESALDTSKRKLSQSLRADRTIYLEEIAKQAEQGDPKDLFKRLRQAGVGGRRKRTLIQPLPTLRNEQGDLVTSFREYAETWRLFLAAQEDGVEVTPEQLIDHIQHGGSRGHTTPIEWQDLPTLTQVERALRQTKIGKAVYDDQIPGELLHYGAKYLAPAALNLLYKQWLCNEEAALFKGGALIPAYKGKGDSTQCASYRSLLISSTLGKVFTAYFVMRSCRRISNRRCPCNMEDVLIYQFYRRSTPYSFSNICTIKQSNPRRSYSLISRMHFIDCCDNSWYKWGEIPGHPWTYSQISTCRMRPMKSSSNMCRVGRQWMICNARSFWAW